MHENCKKIIMLILLTSISAHANESNIVSYVKKDISNMSNEDRVEYLNEVISKQETALAKLYRARGNSYFSLNEFKCAEKDYRKALQESKGGDLEFAIGKCLFEQVKYHEALKMFQMASQYGDCTSGRKR